MTGKFELRMEIKSSAIKTDELKDRRNLVSVTSVQLNHESFSINIWAKKCLLKVIWSFICLIDKSTEKN